MAVAGRHHLAVDRQGNGQCTRAGLGVASHGTLEHEKTLPETNIGPLVVCLGFFRGLYILPNYVVIVTSQI